MKQNIDNLTFLKFTKYPFESKNKRNILVNFLFFEKRVKNAFLFYAQYLPNKKICIIIFKVEKYKFKKIDAKFSCFAFLITQAYNGVMAKSGPI